LWLGRLINVKDVDEKEAILKSLKDIAVDTKEQCIDMNNCWFVQNISYYSKMMEMIKQVISKW
jgi:hypothetical protein